MRKDGGIRAMPTGERTDREVSSSRDRALEVRVLDEMREEVARVLAKGYGEETGHVDSQ